VPAQLVAELADDFAPLGRSPGLPLAEGFHGDGRDLLIVVGGAEADGGDRLARGRVQGLDALARGPEPLAGEGAGVFLLDAEGGEDL
jgi:hypothetical protein